jgi:hypothetical protein
VGRFAGNKPPELLTLAGSAAVPIAVQDVASQGFYEMSTLRADQVAKGKLAHASTLTGTIEVEGQRRELRASFDTHLLFHRSGFVVFRPTARFDQIDVEGGLTPSALHTFERALWKPDADLAWWLDQGDGPVARGWGRNFLNFLFLGMMTRWMGRTASADVLAAQAIETSRGCDEFHKLLDRGVLEHPYPLTFGTEVQVSLPIEASEEASAWRRRASSVAEELMMPLSSSVTVAPENIEPDSSSVCWYFDENRSLLVSRAHEFDDELGVIDRDRTQLVEFLTLRRAALSAVRRTSQHVLIEGSRISRQRIARWQYLVTATTDDYVLDARVGGLLELVRAGFARNPRLRGIADLEGQVRRNLDAFQTRLDSSVEATNGLVAALFGAGALVLGLQGALQLIVATLFGVASRDVAEKLPVALTVAQVSLVFLSLVTSYGVIRLLSRNLQVAPRRSVRRSRSTSIAAMSTWSRIRR